MTTDETPTPKPGKTWNRKKQASFLAAYRTQGTIRAAAELSGVSRNRHAVWLREDPTYAARFQVAEDDAKDSIDEEIRRRAITGVDKPVFQGGKQVGTIRERSDVLLIFLAKGANPEKYRERTENRQTGDVVLRVEVSEQDNWYGRQAHQPTETAAPSDPGTTQPGAV